MPPILCENIILGYEDRSLWLLAAIFLTVAFLFFIFRKWTTHAIMHIALVRFRRRDPEDYQRICDELSPPLRFFLPAVFFTAACHAALFIPLPWYSLLTKIADSLVTAVAFWLLFKTSFIIGVTVMRGEKAQSQPARKSAAQLLVSMIRVGILFIAVFVILSYWVSNVAGLVTGLGIGGLALTLAAQDTIGNFLGSLVILFDQPFQSGDWISTKEAKGEVLSVGVRSTRLRSSDGSLVTVPNKLLAEASVTNETERSRRRAEQQLIIPWEVSWETAEQFKKAVAEQLAAHEKIDAPLVMFSELGTSGMSLYISYYTGGDYRGHMALRDEINTLIARLAQAHNFTFKVSEHLLLLAADEKVEG